MIRKIVFCDLCNPYCRSPKETDGRGVSCYNWSNTRDTMGWIYRRGVGHICPECSDDEEQNRRINEKQKERCALRASAQK